MIFLKKLLYVFIFLLFSTAAFAANVIITWQPNSESDLKEYRLYQSDVSGVQNPKVDIPVTIIPAGTETVEILVEDGIWFWILTAVDKHNNQSLRSNEVTADIDSVAPNAPDVNVIVTVTILK